MISEQSGLKSKFLDTLFDRLIPVFSILLLISVLFVTYEVFARYLFSVPHDFSDDLTLSIILIVIFGGAGLAYYHQQQIIMDLVTLHLKGKTKLLANLLESLFSLAASAIMVYFSAKYFLFLERIGSQSETSIPIPQWIGPLALCIGMLFIALVAFLKVCSYTRSIFSKK